ncbi:MAG TPA: DNA recombination protein RmuC [Ktedonobacterales bacterium]|jgi:DNA recombination protein RmuC
MPTSELDLTLVAACAALAVVLLLVLGYLFGARRRGGKAVALPAGMEGLAPAFGDVRAQIEALRGEFRGEIAELRRSAAAETARRGPEDQAWQTIQQMSASLGGLVALPAAQQALQDQVAGAVRDLASIRELQAAERQRWEREDDAFAALRRLANVMLGSATSGAAGERVVEQMLDALPVEWRATDHKVAGAKVEFAIKLPDGLILPIDSKVVGQRDLDELDGETDQSKRDKLEASIRDNVLRRAREARQYVDTRTPGYAVVAVPDAAYRLCGSVLPKAYQDERTLIVPYSLLAPFVLMVFEQHRRGGKLDPRDARFTRLLADAEEHTAQAVDVLNGHLSGGLTQLTNARVALARELTEARQALAMLRQEADRDKVGKSV